MRIYIQITLLSDGSVTRHLQLMTGQRVSVDCFEMKDIGPFSEECIPCSCDIPGLEIGFETTRRQVFLKLSDTVERPYVYATSWWHKDVVDEYLKDKEKPIWSSLSSERTELYRDIIDVQCGYCSELERYVICSCSLTLTSIRSRLSCINMQVFWMPRALLGSHIHLLA